MKVAKTILLVNLFHFISTVSIAQQIADTDYKYTVKQPMYKPGRGTVITLDEAHYNFHTLEDRYKPFELLLQRDGYVLKAGKEKFTD